MQCPKCHTAMEIGEVCLQQTLLNQLTFGVTPTEVQFVTKDKKDVIPLRISNSVEPKEVSDFLCPECGTVVIPFRL